MEEVYQDFLDGSHDWVYRSGEIANSWELTSAGEQRPLPRFRRGP